MVSNQIAYTVIILNILRHTSRNRGMSRRCTNQPCACNMNPLYGSTACRMPNLALMGEGNMGTEAHKYSKSGKICNFPPEATVYTDLRKIWHGIE